MAKARTNPRTHYATDAQEAAADRLIESVRPAVDRLNEKHPGTWGLVKTALAGLVYNDCDWVANSVAAALTGKGDPSVYVDARVGLKAVDGKWFSRKTPSQITTAVGEIGKLMRGERMRKNPAKRKTSAAHVKGLRLRANPEWPKGLWGASQDFLIKEGGKEYAAQMKQHLKRGLARSTMRYRVPEWHQEMVDALKLDDPSTFLALKHQYLGRQSMRPLKKNPVVTRYKTVSEMRDAGVPDIFHRGRDRDTTMLYSSGEQRPFLAHAGHFLSSSGDGATLMHRKRIGETEGEYAVHGLYDMWGRRKNPHTPGSRPRGAGVNARGGWQHTSGSRVWLAKYATGPSFQIFRDDVTYVVGADGKGKLSSHPSKYTLEAGRWSKAADSFKGGVNMGVYRTLSEAQHEAANMRTRYRLGRMK